MASNLKKQRQESFIKEEIARQILLNEFSPLVKKATITDVRLTDDLSLARVFVDTVNRAEIKDVVGALVAEGGFFRTAVAKELTTRRCPQLRFEPDEAIDNAIKIEEIIKKLHS